MEFIKIIILFLMGCLIGWLIELIYRNLIEREHKNPGFLKGPWLPIYGLGVIIMYFISGLEINFIYKIILFVLVPTILELVTGLFFDKYFNIELWNYSNKLLNYKGYICLLFSFYWGLLGVIYYFLIHKSVVDKLLGILGNMHYVFFYGMIFGIFLLDTIISMNIAFKIKNAVGLFKEKYKLDFNKYKEKSRIFKKIEFGKKEILEARMKIRKKLSRNK